MSSSLAVTYWMALLNACLSITGKHKASGALTVESSRLITADRVGATHQRSLPALVNIVAVTSISSETSCTFTAESEPLAGSTHSVDIAAMPTSKTWILLQKTAVDGANLVAHGVADKMVVSVKHDKDLVYTELLGGQCCPSPPRLIMWAALKGDGLTPLATSCLDISVRRGDGVVAAGGGSDQVSVVVVNLFVWVDLDSRAKRDSRQASIQVCAHYQVVMFIDTFKFLLDA